VISVCYYVVSTFEAGYFLLLEKSYTIRCHAMNSGMNKIPHGHIEIAFGELHGQYDVVHLRLLQFVLQNNDPSWAIEHCMVLLGTE
jgi:hypothetical protein